MKPRPGRFLAAFRLAWPGVRDIRAGWRQNPKNGDTSRGIEREEPQMFGGLGKSAFLLLTLIFLSNHLVVSFW